MSTPPPLPSGAKKPSALASCILLGIVLALVGGAGGGGYWAYQKFLAKPKTEGAEQPAGITSDKNAIAENNTTPPAKEKPPEPVTPAPEPVEENNPLTAKPVIETPAAEDPVMPAKEEPVIPPPVIKTAETDPKEKITPPEVTVTETPVPGVNEPLPEAVSEGVDPVVVAEPIKTFAEDAPEVSSLKEDADRRIDEAPPEIYSDADKEKVRDAIRQAKRLTRVATLQFGKGVATLGANERQRLKDVLLSPEAENLLSDPQAVFFLIGFADSSGPSAVNRSISQKRAAGIGSVLKSLRVTNRTYAVGIGSSSLISGAKQDKNRAVEVWVVLP